MGVYRSENGSKKFQARHDTRRAQQALGTFATAEEAALAVARSLGPEGVAAALAADAAKAMEPAPMTAAEAHAAAAAEGLALVRADNATGFERDVAAAAHWQRQQAVQGAAEARRELQVPGQIRDGGGGGARRRALPRARGRRRGARSAATAALGSPRR